MLNSPRQSLSQSLNRLEQLTSHLNSVWPQPPTTYINLKPNSSLTSSLFLKTGSKKSQSIRQSMKTDTNDQIAKLRKVDTFLSSVDTSLQQIIEGITQIYLKIKKYSHEYELIEEDQDNINENRSENRTMREVEDQRLRYNREVIENIFNFVNQLLFKESLLDIFVQKNPKQLAIWLLQVETKLSVLPIFMPSACQFEPDITTCEPFAGQYPHAQSNIRVVDMDNIKDTITNQLLRLKRMMKIVTSSVVNEMASSKVELFKKIVFGLSFPYFWVADEESQLKCYKIWRNPKVENLNQVWNLPEMGAIKQCKKVTFASIKTSLFIYIPVSKILPENMNKSQYKPDIFSESENYQCVRTSVLYFNRLKFNQEYSKFQPCTCFPCMDIAQQQDLNTILIHLHGGGFVALSSQTMQSYTRKWANELKIPIFSIDYRKPPVHRFPVALEDCVAAYEFIIQNIHKYFKIRPTNVILAGDSAGGNLAVSLYASLLMKNYPVLPKGIFLAYPAVDLRLRFSPSRMNSFSDPILLPPLLLLCLRQYLGENQLNQHHPLASPILLTENYIKSGKHGQKVQMTEKGAKWPSKWPKTIIMVGKKDPLFDDSLRLLQRMTYAGVDAKLTVYNQFSHAFLSLDAVIQSCQTAINDSIQQIKKLM